MIQSISINDFRLFRNVKFNIGKYLTVISGRNATGKSTLLGMLGNSCELKIKDGVPLIHKQFRTEFGEAFKGSPVYDVTGSNKYRINFCDYNNYELAVDYRDFRISWQDERTRFRIIPYRKDESINTSGKIQWPMLYLGLSRLFPIGESKMDGINSTKLNIVGEYKVWFVENYKNILSMHDELTDINSINIGETDRKKGIGVSTANYDFLVNSAGQDNIGQILCAILSFKKLKDEQKEKYTGGMLLIDEVDATIHPSAQNRLVDLLIGESRKLNLQVVFTTHSTSMLRYVSGKTMYNKNDDDAYNEVELIYLTNANRALQLLRNPRYPMIENDLMVQSNVQNTARVKIYSEDDEARWLLKKMLGGLLSRVNILGVEMGCTDLLKLIKADIEYFSKVLIVVDGDVDSNKIQEATTIGKNRLKNVVALPGGKRPEQVFYDYIVGLSNTHSFWGSGFSIGFTWDYFKENGPMSDKYSGKERERYKTWFNQHLTYFESIGLYDYWAKDNTELVDKFMGDFVDSYNDVAKRLFIPFI